MTNIELKDTEIVILKSEYEALMRCQLILDALYAGGVDNWEWYDESLRDLFEDEE